MKAFHKNGGFIGIAILIVLLFMGAASVALVWRADMQTQQGYVADGAGLMQVRNALQSYAVANKSNFVNGKTVMYVNNQYAPTIAELTSLGYFVATGVNTSPYGASYQTKLTLQPNGSITGMAYISGSVINSSGVADPQRACGIARALGDVGLCTNPVNSAMLGGTTQVANPTGLPAIVAAQVYVSP